MIYKEASPLCWKLQNLAFNCNGSVLFHNTFMQVNLYTLLYFSKRWQDKIYPSAGESDEVSSLVNDLYRAQWAASLSSFSRRCKNVTLTVDLLVSFRS